MKKSNKRINVRNIPSRYEQTLIALGRQQNAQASKQWQMLLGMDLQRRMERRCPVADMLFHELTLDFGAISQPDYPTQLEHRPQIGNHDLPIVHTPSAPGIREALLHAIESKQLRAEELGMPVIPRKTT